MFQYVDDFDVHYLTGWEEIRAALEHVEEIKKKGQDAKVEIVNSNADTILRITLRTIDDLENYMKSHLRQMILRNASEDLSTVTGRIILQ